MFMSRLIWFCSLCWLPFLLHAGDEDLLPAMADGDGASFARAWQVLPLEGLNLRRLAVPFGWLVSESSENDRPANLIFLPDRDYSWRAMHANQWESLALQDAVLFRLKVPSGWLVRESLEVGAHPAQAETLVFVPDRRHGWQPRASLVTQ